MLSSAPNVEERYITACNARTLTVEARRSGAADALIAAGSAQSWSRARIGLALLRLHSEWDAQHGARGGRHERGHRGEMASNRRNLTGAENGAAPLPKMRSLPELHAQLLLEATRRAMAEPAVKAAQVLAWWLRPVCPTCSGRRWRVVDGTPSLSGVRCGDCNGHGTVSIPCGDDGRRLAAFIEACLDDARNTLHRRLRVRANAR